jgi:hypothetical protein
MPKEKVLTCSSHVSAFTFREEGIQSYRAKVIDMGVRWGGLMRAIDEISLPLRDSRRCQKTTLSGGQS